jgi:hypothetical protein
MAKTSLLASTIDIKEDEKVTALELVYDIGNQTYLVFDSVVNFQGLFEVR